MDIDCDRTIIRQSANSVLAQRVLESRRVRTRIFGAGLFADPAYDIILFMLIKHEANELVSTAKVCEASDVPEPTALRYIRSLIKLGYLERMAHPHDRRIVNLKLSQLGLERMEGWLTRFCSALTSQ